MSVAIIIPARYGSSRLPGKPMLTIAGISMLERVWRIANKTKGCTRVVVSTEDQRIVDHARSFGAEAVVTPDTCANGTERVFATIEEAGITESNLINFQGDAVLTPPWVLQALIDELSSSAGDLDLVTPAVALDETGLRKLHDHKRENPSSGTTVVFNKKRNALYFSKTILPYIRTEGLVPVYRHIGLYGYTSKALAEYVRLAPSPLEQTEGLEQLRALENDMTVRVVVVDYQGRTHGSVDTPDDIKLVEQIIANEGELFEVA